MKQCGILDGNNGSNSGALALAGLPGASRPLAKLAKLAKRVEKLVKLSCPVSVYCALPSAPMKEWNRPQGQVAGI